MSIEQDIRDHLLADTDVSALVGTEISYLFLNQNFSLPAIVYRKVSASRVHDLSGPTGRVDARFQIDLYSESSVELADLSDKVRVALDGFKGTLGTRANVGGIHLVSENDLFEAGDEIFRKSHDYMVFYYD